MKNKILLSHAQQYKKGDIIYISGMFNYKTGYYVITNVISSNERLIKPASWFRILRYKIKCYLRKKIREVFYAEQQIQD